jgi:hypothetical protein
MQPAEERRNFGRAGLHERPVRAAERAKRGGPPPLTTRRFASEGQACLDVSRPRLSSRSRCAQVSSSPEVGEHRDAAAGPVVASRKGRLLEVHGKRPRKQDIGKGL